MTATYSDPINLARFLNIEARVPALRPPGASRKQETIGTDNGTVTTFFTDFGFIIDNTLILYTSNGTGSAVLGTSEYTVDLDMGKITLGSTGTAALGTSNLLGEYSYVEKDITNTQLQEALNRAQADIDEKTDNHWADTSGSASATPDYNQVTEEKHVGKGRFNRDYFTEEFPIPNVQTMTNGTVTSGTARIVVDSTDGFPNSGSFAIENDKISYTGKSGTAFNGCSGVEAHDSDKPVTSWVIEFSSTQSGSEPSWTVMQQDSDYDIELITGKIHLYRADFDLLYTNSQYPGRLIPNRFRITYQHGNEGIPGDIKQLTLMLASKDLMHSTLRRTTITGQSSDKADNLGIDNAWIDSIIREHTSMKSRNV